VLSMVVGHQVGVTIYGLNSQFGLYGAGLGAFYGVLIVIVEWMTQRVSLRGMSAAVFGLLMALIMAHFVSGAIDTIDMNESWRLIIKSAIVMLMAYMGVIFSIRGKDEFSVIIPYVKFQRKNQSDTAIILDTSAIIDGRVSDILKTHFIEGYFVVPKFVLKELQALADSRDGLKRERGKRGLDVLNKLKKNPRFNFKINNEDFEEIDGVDQKLLKLAGVLDGKIMTTDYNLNKVAEFNDIVVLNINELSKALRPVLLTGEHIEVHLAKEGKERLQAVGYLDDGTMVVVEDGREKIGSTVKATVTTVLQTPAGRMVFSNIESQAKANE
jgi:uncharacterized protein YacL